MKSFLDWVKASTKVKRWIFLILLGIIAICYAISQILVTEEMEFSELGKIIFIFVVGFVSITLSIVFIQKRSLELIIEANDVDEKSQKAKVNIKSLIFNKKVYEDGPKIVVIGGGDGLNAVLAGLKKYTNNLTAIVTMSDYSENKTISKEVLNLLPVDDIKNSIISMSDREDLMGRLMNLDFGENSALNGLNFGDIYLAAMNEISGNISEAIRKSTEVLNITGKVIPVTLDKITIAADFSDGTHVTTRKDFIEAVNNKIVEINRVFISPSNCRPAPGVLDAIAEAEAIVIAPGSLYTSVLPTLLVKNIVNAIRESKALKIFISNIMTEPGQTDDFSLSDHLRVIKEHIGVDLFDVCLVDNGEVVPEYVRKYNKDGAELVEIDQKNIPNVRVVEKKLSTIVDGKIRHNPQVVAMTIVEFICNELKFQDEHHGTEYLLLQSVLKEQRKLQAKKEKDIAKGKLPTVKDKDKSKSKSSKFKEKYKDRFSSIKTVDIARDERRKKAGLEPRGTKSKTTSLKQNENKILEKKIMENKPEIKPEKTRMVERENVIKKEKSSDSFFNKLDGYKALMRERQEKKEEEAKRKKELEFEKIEKQREQRRIENERRETEERENAKTQEPKREDGIRQTRRQRIEEEERMGQRAAKRNTSSNDLVQNQDLLNQIARLNKNRTQMRESLNKTRSNSKQSKH